MAINFHKIRFQKIAWIEIRKNLENYSSHWQLSLPQKDERRPPEGTPPRRIRNKNVFPGSILLTTRNRPEELLLHLWF